VSTSPDSPPLQALTNQDQNDLARYSALLLQQHPDLKQIIESWSEMPEPVKAGILAMVQVCEKKS